QTRPLRVGQLLQAQPHGGGVIFRHDRHVLARAARLDERLRLRRADAFDATTRVQLLAVHVEQAVLEAGPAQLRDEDSHFKNVSSPSRSGRGMTCADTSSPFALAACAPASIAARTLPTSPRTNVVTKALPICTWPARVTFAALHIASVAAIVAIRPRVSISPSASPLPFRLLVAIDVFS